MSNLKLKKLLALSKDNNLHHALLFTGKNHNSLVEMANTLIKARLCKELVSDVACNKCQSCLLFNANTHPDILELKLEEKASSIKVDAIRNLNNFVSNSPQVGSNKIALIYAADKLNIQSSNALLKTLEEPSLNTTIILIAKSRDDLLPTIISRCLEVYISGQTPIDTEIFTSILADLDSLLVSRSASVVEIAERWDTLAKDSEYISSIYQVFATIIIKRIGGQDYITGLANNTHIQGLLSLLTTVKLFSALNSIIEFKKVTKAGNNPNFQLFLIGFLSKLEN